MASPKARNASGSRASPALVASVCQPAPQCAAVAARSLPQDATLPTGSNAASKICVRPSSMASSQYWRPFSSVDAAEKKGASVLRMPLAVETLPSK